MWESVTAAAALAAAVAAAWAAVETRRTTSGILLRRLIADYATDQMNEDLRRLRRWLDENPGRVAEAFVDLEAADLEEWTRLNESRRRVKFYFLTVHRLYSAESITWLAAHEAWSVSGYELFRDVVQPLEATTTLGGDGPYAEIEAIRSRLQRRRRVLRGHFR